MHPVIRILALLLGMIMVVLGSWLEWLFALVCVGLLVIWVNSVSLQPMFRMIAKLRWLILSIIIIYLFFTPGDPLLPELLGDAASLQGLVAGSYRVSVLLLMVMAVSVILQSTDKEQLVAALLWIFSPAERLGFSLERLAVRLVLTMEAVDTLHDMARRPVVAGTGVVARIRTIVGEMVDLFDHVTQHAQSQTCQTIVVPVLIPPNWQQWLLLILFFGVFLLL